MANQTLYVAPSQEQVWADARAQAAGEGVSLSVLVFRALRLAQEQGLPPADPDEFGGTWVTVSGPLYLLHLGLIASDPPKNAGSEAWREYRDLLAEEGRMDLHPERVYAIGVTAGEDDVQRYLTASFAESAKYVVTSETPDEVIGKYRARLKKATDQATSTMYLARAAETQTGS